MHRSYHASEIYEHFLREVARAQQAWCLKCDYGEVCAVHGSSGRLMLPLWQDAENAQYHVPLYWPDHRPIPLELEVLLGCCLVAADRCDIPAGIGRAPDPETVVMPARRLRLDLIIERVRSMNRLG